MGNKNNLPTPEKAFDQIQAIIETANKAIVPITFVGNDKVERSNDVNNTFVDPYMYKLAGDTVEVPMMSNKIKNAIGIHGATAAYQYIGLNRKAYNCNIINYIHMNTRDLVYSTLVRFNADVFSSKNNDSLVAPFSLIERMEIDKLLDEVMRKATNPYNNVIETIMSMNNRISPDSARSFMNQYINIIYSYLVTDIFDRYIIKLIETLYEANAFTVVFELLKVKCYGEDAENVEYDVSQQYAFVSSILREIMEQYLFELVTCLVDVGRTALNMISISPIEFLNTDIIPEPRYCIDDDEDDE